MSEAKWDSPIHFEKTAVHGSYRYTTPISYGIYDNLTSTRLCYGLDMRHMEMLPVQQRLESSPVQQYLETMTT